MYSCHDFVNLTFAKKSPLGLDVSHSSTKDHKGIEIEQFVTHRSWRRYTACLLDSQAEAGLVILTQKNRIWRSSSGVFVRGAQGRLLIRKAVGKVTSGTYMYL